MRTTICHKAGCYRPALSGEHFCQLHRELEKNWGKRKAVRGKSSAWHHLYASARWRRESREFLERFPYCAVCGMSARIVDHIQPHRGDERLFWDKSNWQPMCEQHHRVKTLAENNFHKGDTPFKNISRPEVDQHAPSRVCTCKMRDTEGGYNGR